MVVNIRKADFDIYIGRPRSGGEWGFGNPFQIGPDGWRPQVLYRCET